MIVSDCDFGTEDTVTFSLEAGKHYNIEILISEVFDSVFVLYEVILNNEPIIIITSDIEPGVHNYPFFTGTILPQLKITGGTDADISEFPWQVYYKSGDYLCGGSIISENWIITAAHCTKNQMGRNIPVNNMLIKAGVTNPYDETEGKIYDIKNVIIHENFNTTSLDNDIALLELHEPIDFENAEAIEIVTVDDADEGATDPGMMAWITGWGLINVRPEILPQILQKIQLPIVSNETAAQVWGELPETNIAAGFLNGNKDACNGDSGGPLIVNFEGKRKLAGLVSYGSEKCNTYGVYTRVSSYESWIREKTGIEEKNKLAIPEGDTFICQGKDSGNYSTEIIPEATSYEWKLFPEEAGKIESEKNQATVLWNKSYYGLAKIKVRVTLDGELSGWSRLYVDIGETTSLFRQQGDTVICAEQPVILDLLAEGHDLTYNWYKDDHLIYPKNSNKIEYAKTSTDNSGIYQCEISGSCGTILSDYIDLIVHPLTEITDMTQNVSVDFGNQTIIEINAQGHNLQYQWVKDGELLMDENSPILLVQDVNANDIGTYQVTVTGTCGTVISDSVYLFVNKPDSKGNNRVYIWPAVSGDEFNIALNNDDIYSIRLFNMNGQSIKSLKYCQYRTKINLFNISQGIYLVNIISDNINETCRIIINR